MEIDEEIESRLIGTIVAIVDTVSDNFLPLMPAKDGDDMMIDVELYVSIYRGNQTLFHTKNVITLDLLYHPSCTGTIR